MARFNEFNKFERGILISALIKECKEYIDYGINGFNNEGKLEYNAALSLLKEVDVEKKYQYIYKDWKFVEFKK